MTLKTWLNDLPTVLPADNSQNFNGYKCKVDNNHGIKGRTNFKKLQAG